MTEKSAPTETVPSMEALRTLAWELGGFYDHPRNSHYCALVTQQPHQGVVHWLTEAQQLEDLKDALGSAFEGAAHVARIYDVTDVVFDGLNAHSFFDLGIAGLSGSHFFHTLHGSRRLLAEVGFRLRDGRFCALDRSQIVVFEKHGQSGNYDMAGRFVSADGRYQFPVENVFDAPVYARMAVQMACGLERTPPALGLILSTPLLYGPTEGAALREYVREMALRWQKMGVKVELSLENVLADASMGSAAALKTAVQKLSKQWEKTLIPAWKAAGVAMVIVHDVISAQALAALTKKAGVAMIFSMHHLTHEDACPAAGNLRDLLMAWEREAVEKSVRVIVAHSYQREQVMQLMGAPAEKVWVIADLVGQAQPKAFDPGKIKEALYLNPTQGMALFAGEIGHGSGADLLIEAFFQVSGALPNLQLVLVGEGPLKGELENRINSGGLGHRVRFTGDTPRDWFEQILLASDFVVIPARSRQDEGLAQWAVHCGKPVFTTHQAGLGCIRHGQNGVVSYDNPGSVVWGLKEMVARPLQGHMMRLVARQRAEAGRTLSGASVEHLVCVMDAVKEEVSRG